MDVEIGKIGSSLEKFVVAVFERKLDPLMPLCSAKS